MKPFSNFEIFEMRFFALSSTLRDAEICSLYTLMRPASTSNTSQNCYCNDMEFLCAVRCHFLNQAFALCVATSSKQPSNLHLISLAKLLCWCFCCMPSLLLPHFSSCARFSNLRHIPFIALQLLAFVYGCFRTTAGKNIASLGADLSANLSVAMLSTSSKA